MGTNNSAISQEDMKNYQVIQKKEYANLAEMSEVRSSDQDQNYYLMFKSLYAIDSKEKETNQVEKNRSLSHLAHTAELVQYKINEAHQMCFQNYVLNLYFEYSDKSINRLIKNAKANNYEIPEKQIWMVLNDCTEHIKAQDSIGSMHGDLKSQYIFFTPDMAEVKVINPLSYTKFGTGYNVLLGESKTEYKTPLSIISLFSSSNLFFSGY